MTILTDEEINVLVKEAAQGSAIKRDGSTSQRIARAIEYVVQDKLRQQKPVAWMMTNEECGHSPELYFEPKLNWHITWKAAPLYAAPMPTEDARIDDRDAALLHKTVEAHELRKQRDELLAALKKLSGMKLNMIADGIVDKAIASVKGGAE